MLQLFNYFYFIQAIWRKIPPVEMKNIIKLLDYDIQEVIKKKEVLKFDLYKLLRKNNLAPCKCAPQTLFTKQETIILH